MSFNRNENLKIVGFFGQSGAGKTTIIRNVKKKINNQVVLQNTGIIRYLFSKNNKSGNYYLNPETLIKERRAELDNLKEEEKIVKINEIYEKYIRSQMQLLNDWSTEIYIATIESYTSKSILLLDRSPVDFYVLTLCGIKVLMDAFGQKLNRLCERLIELNAKIATENTNNFFNAIFIIKPWHSANINVLYDGVRDQYLTEDYIGSNWYSKASKVKLIDDIKVFTIGEDVTDLYKRADLVSTKLMEI